MLQTLGFSTIFGGLVLLRLAWRQRGRRPEAVLGGWLMIASGFLALCVHSGAELGIAYATMALSIFSYLVIAATFERRASRNVSATDRALEPEVRRVNLPRAVVKSLLAIVLAGVTSVGFGVAFAVSMPLDPPDRIMIGGLLVPLLWGGGMAWTLSDPKLLRATALLTLLSVTSYALAFLPKAL
jgi:hypothetical protein